MREIKFRAWDKKSKFMINHHNINYGILQNREEHRFELMQYTGLKDKNGKEIYEGDIVKTKYGVAEIMWHEKLVWDGGGSCHSGFYPVSIYDKEYEYLDMDFHLHMEDCEVIGNIYEIKELLK